MISIIIPVYNEEKVLLENLSFFSDLFKQAELIFVDGESSDRSVEVAARFGKVISSEKGLADQMNFGARDAANDILLFLHADCRVSLDTLGVIEADMEGGGFVGGCLTQRIDKEGLVFRVIEALGNIRAALTKVFYGDQGIFVKKDVFLELGGFPEVPVMEDVLFTKKLRKAGKTKVLGEQISVSPRRWVARGVMRNILLYSLMNIMFWFKVPLRNIKALYNDVR